MKTLHTLITLFLFVPAMAQIPNAGFENWEQKTIFGTTFNDPVGWLSINYANAIENIPAAATQTTDAYSGNFALKLTNTEGEDKLAASISTMKLNGMEFIDKIPITSRVKSLKGYYKYSYTDKDTCLISLSIYKNGSAIGSGFLEMSTITENYTAFEVPVEYYNSDTTIIPDSAFILIQAAQNSNREDFNEGVTLYIDELSFEEGPTTAIRELKPTLDVDLFPNPAQEFVTVSLKQTAKPTIEVYDITGKLHPIIPTEVAPKQYGFNVNQLPKGIYLVKVMAANEYRTFRVLVQ